MAHLPGNASTTMTATTTRAASTRAANRTNVTPASTEQASTKNRRVSLGTLYPTKNNMFMSGSIKPAGAQYLNQSEFLGLLGPAPAGYQWRIKAFFKTVDMSKKPEVQDLQDIADIVAELEPIQR